MSSTPYSRNTFDEFAKVRNYVSVRLKQGVPLVDADINEANDMRRYELRNFLRWFVGNGVPEQNDGFRILDSSQANEVIIAGGDGTPEGGGRCLVDGMEVINPTDVLFSEQEFADANSAANAGVDHVTSPETPSSGTRVDIYYLDVWEREITSLESGHEDIVDPRIGIEAARRLRREWAVRVIDEITGVPANDTPAGHRYYPLASVLRIAGEDVIPASSIFDLRRRNVTLQSRMNFDQIILDAFGGGYTADENGQANLAASLRDVINAMLRSGRAAPIGPHIIQSGDGPYSFPASIVDANGNQWLFWFKGTTEIWYTRQFDGEHWLSPEQWRTLTGATAGISLTATSDGTVWVFWDARIAANQYDILGQVYHEESWGAEFTVSTSGVNIFAQNLSTAVNSSDEIMVIWKEQSLSGITFQSRLYLGSQNNAQAIVEISNQFQSAPVVVATQDDDFHVYGTDGTSAPSAILTANWSGGPAWSAPGVVGSISAGLLELAAAADRFAGVWLIYADGQASLTGRYLRSGFPSDPAILIDAVDVPRYPSAMRDSEGNIRVYYRPGSGIDELHELNLISRI